MNVLILGTGSWGTALATVLAHNDHQVLMWTREAPLAKQLNATHINHIYHPEITLTKSIQFTSALSFPDVYDLIVYACPSYAVENILQKLHLNLAKHSIFVSTAKGINNTSLFTVSETLAKTHGQNWCDQHFAVLSGPSFAYDVIRQKPTAVTVATKYEANALQVQEAFHHSTFHVYRSDDVIGVEIAGALKNVIAIAAGVCDGLDLGPSARSALITRGLAEIIKIGQCKGAKIETFSGLSGLGDLLLTCTSDLSRNRRVGKLLAKGLSLRQVIKELGQVVEGIRTSKSAFKMVEKLNIDSVIIKQIYQALYQHKPLQDALGAILNQNPSLE